MTDAIEMARRFDLAKAAPDLLDAVHDLLTRPTCPAARLRAREAAAKATGTQPTEILIDPIHKYIDPTPTIYVLFSDDGRHMRKWSFEPFETGVRYIPAFMPHWDNPDGPGAA